MKLVTLAVGVLALSALSFAADDAWVGTWKLNVAKSKYTTGQPPKAQTVVIAREGDAYRFDITGTAPNGTPIMSRFSVPESGGTGTVEPGGVWDGVSAKKVDERTREMTYMKGGQPSMTVRAVAARDGKTLRVTAKGKNPMGEAVEGVSVFERQEEHVH
jgi:hypothetical protein